ncbi:AAA family ATPase [Xenorhabdus sp. DI]|uniref:AAA family ATPase n=1 Tax=Xenorhabdus doucetiae TaxID=351671 RepID=UPI001996800E|nr:MULTISPECIES: AAA family ATPase [unclassified Xenorhabdus]MBD2785102.1 AAA family ATPase [Xenorhabdus sp. 3]MBD2787565.1 AAA family ATPase [Xenorhabdus sp. DI]
MNCLININRKLMEHGINIGKVNRILSLLLSEDIEAFGSKPKCLLISGASGSGKTRLANILKQVSTRIMSTIDSKDLSEVGYSGKDPSSIFEKLIYSSGGDCKVAAKGIVHLDEFDKLSASFSIEKDVNGIGIQQSLLKPLDGIEIGIVNPNPSRANPNPTLNLDTSGMIFVFTGSFSGKKISCPKDLMSSGFIPELANRIDFFLHLKEPSEDELYKMARDDEFYEKAVKFAKSKDVNISFDDSFKLILASEAFKLGGHYRSVSYLFNNIVYDKIVELIISREKSYEFSKYDLEGEND